MWQYTAKLLVSATVIVIVSELAKRNSMVAALVAALPLTSLIAFVWLHVEGAESERIAALSGQIGWLVLPSLVLFILLPVLLRQGFGFWFSLASASLVTGLSYGGLLVLLRRLGVHA
ncbi:MAG: DUF3147 family protein [Sterolibacteriaceae bacterium]|uniref:DUF3147 family protein n=1 Tax=Candidatus Methylophosphatis roskildensis TaxID=2899263 RepID=A0A9D7DW18_9PROT|nr:DUF3147 family protein [Candidatus Methylophosphatis roskildensis]MBK7234116.1 DUF3147 family protein [Sterolibacteriaceae bacterium]